MHNSSKPDGTVTFLFTDIEGSTTLAQNYPGEINLLLERHNAILRQSIEAHNGFVFRTVGDAFCAAFHTVPAAVSAALDAQRIFQHEAWQPAPVRVRMGIHTGAVQVKEQVDHGYEYEGYLTLTRVQRVMSVAHGGQVLLSSASAELVRGSLPEDGSLRDMGEHRLKGLDLPERLWQLVLPDLVSEFPPLLSLNATPNNLPALPAAMIGREAELSEVVRRLSVEDVRLLTLTGPGGIGKTRMALQAASELIEHFEDGVFFIDLAAIRDPAFVPVTIAQTLGLRDTGDRPIFEELTSQLQAKTMLLILDNFEQVTPAVNTVVKLLRDCPQLRMMVTSREALHVRGEYVFPIPTLTLPETDLQQPATVQITQYGAVQLFIERAVAVKPDFSVTNENAPAVAEICWQLDGLPLAIELAAARIRMFSPQALLERLGSRLTILRGGARDLPARQQTLRDTIEWGYELLEIEEQRLFQVLSAFSGGCTLEAVEVTASSIESLTGNGMDILEGLTSLVEKSMVQQAEQKNGEYRFLMLGTMRDYAAERLDEHPELREPALRSHAAFFASFAERQWERMTGADRNAALEEMSDDLENLRSAWRFWVKEKDLQSLNKFVDSFWLLFDVRGWYHATVDLTNDLLEVLSCTPTTPELAQQDVVLRTSLARALLAIKGYTPEVEEAYTRALELSQTVGGTQHLFPVLRGLYSFYTFRAEFDKVLPIGKQILELAERYDDGNLRVEGHFVLGTGYSFTGNYILGLEHLEKSISFIDHDQSRSSRFRLGNFPGVSSYIASALILWGRGYPERAVNYSEQALELAKKANHPYSLAYALFHSGYLHYWMQEIELSLGYSRMLLDLAGKHKFQIWHAVGTCLYGIGIAIDGRGEEGLALIQEGMDLYQGLKSPPIFWPLLRSFHARACGLVGRAGQGLAYLDELMSIPGTGYGNVLMIEILLLKGDLLLALSPDNLNEAENYYRQATTTAREYEATMLELQAAISLARLWQNQEGRNMLGEVYAKFTEGFSTPILKAAREILI